MEAKIGEIQPDRPVAVLKFGGTSLSDSEKIRRAAKIAGERHLNGFATVVVVSAQASITDRLIQQARDLANEPNLRELDLLLSSGERISAALLAICLNAAGVPAIGLTGSQAGIITDTHHNRARIVGIRPFRIAEALKQGKVVVVGGFQGVSNEKEITTLGRGGSDITAVTLAGALRAQRCEIFSDVDGIFSADPRIVENPLKRDKVSFVEMEEFARSGARVLHPEAVAQARIGGIPIHARTSFEPHATGTIIQGLEKQQTPRLLGIASLQNVTWIELQGSGLQLFQQLEEFKLHFCALWNSRPRASRRVWNLLVSGRENLDLEPFLKSLEVGEKSMQVRSDLCLISLVGEGCGQSPQLLGQSLRCLSLQRLEPLHMEVHPHSLRWLFNETHHDTVVGLLHSRFITRSPSR